MEHDIRPLSELTDAQAAQAFDMFAEGFYFIFSPISKDKARLRELFLASFDREMAWVCLIGGRPVGFVACGTSERQPVNMRKEDCLRVLGRAKGTLVYWFAAPILAKPHARDPGEGYLDYLTTDPAFRGRGIGTAMFRHVCETLPYERYTFEVLSRNETAIRLYTKLGMRRVRVKNDPVASLVGHGKPVIMAFEAKEFLRQHSLWPS
ncbi:MAG: GNAT family N-acetyltransferase [Oscillospiraceae bacterium]|jgi:ribosomal protein S18 acetylase RimI-like enzyme|nr:GNAT family N-acetyltransferase [Oscillospiraceae bacterium]